MRTLFIPTIYLPDISNLKPTLKELMFEKTTLTF